MDQINNIQVVPCTSSNHLKPFRVHYSQNGAKKSWDFMRTHESVSVLIFNTTSHCFILVKQFRPAVYVCEWERSKPGRAEQKEGEAELEAGPAPEEGEEQGETGAAPDLPPVSAGVTYELCAGLVDKPDVSLEEIARQGVLQECGYDVPVTKLRRITSYRSGVGVTGAKQTLFYAEVSEENHVGPVEGEPREGEAVEVVKVPLQEAMTFAYDESIPKTIGVIFSFIWFHSNMSPKYKISTNV
ncbi:uridine diphosphate glucose pyrophosphatase NUDT14-like [Megalops cyprinoides]|uniref:uridine diphosphate glucose pyrophosphatase NUDT14-like n=1 Tax=Megalops cyprinoides TaxID=118141 RepID=UPI00186558E6|nr:uridine diphosphate glucose pyrophosphatase NUDT14-like [Megalops cyprinoides]XP_036405098.1 uridine diphosphate glucose pyrophosphatase NUDT14-like [Megalops cyprinoides]